MSRRTILMLAAFFLVAGALTQQGCSSGNPAEPPYSPDIPAAWAESVTNPLFPLTPGTTYTFGGVEDVTVEVLTGTKVVNGVTATVVRDRVYVGGELIEDTQDWYVQDLDGNVWYVGEDVKDYVNGVLVSTAGSWEWGVDGALPGIIMWADPAAHVGEKYRQEYYKGEAEDFGKVLATGVSVTVQYGNLSGCVRIEDTSGLDPAALEWKYYCPGLGNVLITAPDGSERTELTGVTVP